MKTTINTPKKSPPLTISIEGKLARKIRDHAKELGVQSKTLACQYIKWGHLCVADTKEARGFRDGLGDTSSVNIRYELVELLTVLLNASGTNLSVGEYVEKSIIGQLAESLQPVRYGEGLQEFVANEYDLEPQDIPNMNRAAELWASRNPEAAGRIQWLATNR